MFANELLDNVPCDVVELDAAGTPRLVEVDRATGDERLGAAVDAEQLRWLATWWPLVDEGERAEIGLTRDAMWTSVSAANPRAWCVAVDYGHVLADRPAGGSLSPIPGRFQAPSPAPERTFRRTSQSQSR